MYKLSKINCTKFRKSHSFNENEERKVLKRQYCSHKVYMSHQVSVIDHCFPLNLQVLERNFLTKNFLY